MSFFLKIWVGLGTVIFLSGGVSQVKAYQEIPQNVVEKARSSVVSITSKLLYAAYGSPGEICGSGFLVDQKRGIILTNRHVVGAPAIGSFEVTFYNGRRVEAHLLYYDPWQDFAFLKIDPKHLTHDIQALPLHPKGAVRGSSVFILGQNAGQSFSLQTGHISTLYDASGVFPTQSIRISLNTRGGGSGSPLCDEKGRVVGLIHSSDMDSFGFAIPIEFVWDAFEDLKKASLPVRRGTGALVAYKSIDELARVFKFSPEFVADYYKKYPDSLGKLLVVQSIFQDSPAHEILFPGDVILAVDGEEVGPSFYKMDALLNQAKQPEVRITLLRSGKLQDVSVKLYDLHASTVQRMLFFAGCLFYEADEFSRRVLGANKGEVLLTHIRQGSSLSHVFPPIPGGHNVYFLHVQEVGGKPIQTLRDLTELIPALTLQRYFGITYRNYAFSLLMQDTPLFSKNAAWEWVELNPLDQVPQIFSWDMQHMAWQQELLPLPKPQEADLPKVVPATDASLKGN
ncbi:MAG: S1C family serine protease [Alphaproteobacteria bacterium]